MACECCIQLENYKPIIKRLVKLFTIPLSSPTDKLQKSQNRAARIITRANYSSRSSDVLNSLEWSNLGERRKRHLLVTMFKVFNNNCSTYLRQRFHRTSEIHDYNLRGSNYDFKLPLPKTNFLFKAFIFLTGCNGLEPIVKSNT